MSLKQKTIQGLFWTLGQQFSGQLISLIVQIFLARLLVPESFGLIAMLQIFIALSKSLVDSGMTNSLIRDNKIDQRDYSTVFFINIFVSFFLYIIIYFSAPLVSRFYEQPQLTSIIRVYSLIIIIQALNAVQITKLIKEMKFKLQMILELPSIILGSFVGLYLAYNGYGVWSLVWMYLIRSIIWTLLHWSFSKWTPDFIFDLKKLKYHFHFGYKLTLSGLLDILFKNSYSVLIGKFFNITQLGYYDRAVTFRNITQDSISTALGKVTYPMFVNIQDNPVRLKLVFKQILMQVLFIIAPLMIILSLIAEPAFRWILTEKWIPAVPYFQILCIAGILHPLHVYNLNILKVKGRSDLFLKLEIYKKIMMTILIICSIPFGIYGLLYVQILISIFSYLINAMYSGKLVNYSLYDQIKDILPIILLAIISGIISWLFIYLSIKHVLLPDPAIIIITCIFFIIVYFGLAAFFKLSPYEGFKKLLQNIFPILNISNKKI
ncbi:lipopolysaccharide biosynthesis protein [Terrimonas alba]|uniref:lipopolysaccharide biosynthesis protein n=1 Tax=Terrimonas alba TaxID=3349636 RepID=UPI0035F3CB93